MSHGINSDISSRKRAFTLVETLTSALIAMFILLSIWSIYFIGWKWWHEMAPIVEAQRAARIALSSVVDGTVDPTAGQETIIGKDYGFRNGIAWTALTNQDCISSPSFTTPVISADGHQIDFKLEKDTAAVNGRSFYAGSDAATGATAVYYRDNSGSTYKIKGTEIGAGTGSISLTFERDAVYTNLIKVTVSVQKTVPGTKYESAPFVVVYSDFVYCRNL
jgi:hypothetical protein